MKSILSLLVAVLASTAVYAQSASHATARIFEAQNKKLSRIVLVYETGESEVIPLEAFKLFGGDQDEMLVNNQKTINKMINDMEAKGYKVVSMNTTSEVSLFYSFILFEKQ